jgi:hypothetical protein
MADERRVRSVTRHIRRTRRIRRAADAQLPVAIHAPALDRAPANNRARVSPSQGDGDGGKACQEKNVEEINSRMKTKAITQGPTHASKHTPTYCLGSISCDPGIYGGMGSMQLCACLY